MGSSTVLRYLVNRITFFLKTASDEERRVEFGKRKSGPPYNDSRWGPTVRAEESTRSLDPSCIKDNYIRDKVLHGTQIVLNNFGNRSTASAMPFAKEFWC